MAELLVKACADLTARNNDGLTPLELARKGLVNGTSEWQKVRCRELEEVLDVARERETPVAFTNVLPAQVATLRANNPQSMSGLPHTVQI